MLNGLPMALRKLPSVPPHNFADAMVLRQLPHNAARQAEMWEQRSCRPRAPQSSHKGRRSLERLQAVLVRPQRREQLVPTAYRLA